MFPGFVNRAADEVARQLLGCELHRYIDNELIRVKIVETESYDQTDQASHTYNGQTARNSVMFGEAGFLYVYFTYGMHYCCNVVAGEAGYGAAALIRAVEPLEGGQLMERFRNKTGVSVSNGPAKLCQSLMIGKSFNGHDLRQVPLTLIQATPVHDTDVVNTTRIGISRAQDELKRWYIKDNPYVSKA
ncbi:MAG: DNA-3-methyladenine glycosylase [Candidatus Saccharimonadales bacterium]